MKDENFYDNIIINLIDNDFFKKLPQEKLNLIFEELNKYYIEKFNEKCNYVLIDEEEQDSFIMNTMIINKCINEEGKEEFFKKCIYYLLTCMGVVQNQKISWHTKQEEIEHTTIAMKDGKITRVMTTKQAEENYAQIVIDIYNELQYYMDLTYNKPKRRKWKK